MRLNSFGVYEKSERTLMVVLFFARNAVPPLSENHQTSCISLCPGTGTYPAGKQTSYGRCSWKASISIASFLAMEGCFTRGYLMSANVAVCSSAGRLHFCRLNLFQVLRRLDKCLVNGLAMLARSPLPVGNGAFIQLKRCHNRRERTAMC